MAWLKNGTTYAPAIPIVGPTLIVTNPTTTSPNDRDEQKAEDDEEDEEDDDSVIVEAITESTTTLRSSSVGTLGNDRRKRTMFLHDEEKNTNLTNDSQHL